MKITDIKAHVLKPFEQKFQWKEEWAPREVPSMFVRVLTDEGHEGQCVTWLLNPGEFEDSLPGLKAAVVGRDIHDIEAMSYAMTDRLQRPNASSSTVDICLWDAFGKHHDEPIYKLLGAARHEIRAYASTMMYQTDQEWVDLALACRGEGFNAYKIHPYGVPDKDIRLCRAVREAVGDTMDLMLDPVNAYDRQGAFAVAKVLEELDFYWFEAPIPDSDLQGLVDLTRTFTIPIAGVESVMNGFRFYAPYVANHVVDSVRTVGDVAGGITAMRKSAALCEAFNIKYEPHSYGPTHIQAAHMHVMLAIHNCDFVEAHGAAGHPRPRDEGPPPRRCRRHGPGTDEARARL
ncbi:MAG: mandelate racemase/muconate lactonizing enzyme family protein [Ilumatobacteraceae bacterium]